MQARYDQAITVAWHGEAFARQKKLQPLDKLLKRHGAESAEAEALKVAAALDRLARKVKSDD